MSSRYDWKHGLAWGTLTEENMQECAKGGIQCVEFHQCPEISSVRRWSENTGVTVWSRHLVFGRENIGHRTQERVDETVEIYKKAIDEAAEAGATNVVIHPSGEPNEEEVREERLLRSIDAFGKLVDFSKQYGITVCCENLPRTCLCRDSAECLRMVESVPGLKLCFDTNHLLKESHKDFIRKVGKYIQTTHVSDYDFVDEKHWFPLMGEGKIDWKTVIAELEAVDYKGPFLYETGLPSDDFTLIPRTNQQLFAL